MAYIPCRIGGGAIINIPNGKTVTPTDDIQTWLHCAGVFDNNYTTLAQILADTSVFTTLLADSNACDYMARSTSWALAEGLVPTMTSDNTPSGQVTGTTPRDTTTYNLYKALDNNDTTQYQGNMSTGAGSSYSLGYIQYQFANPVNISMMRIMSISTLPFTALKVEVSSDGTTYNEIYNKSVSLYDSFIQLQNATNVSYVKVTMTQQNNTSSSVYLPRIYTLQFYEADITRNQDAMSLIGKYDYCSNELLSNATWASAIGNSDYFEEVLNVKVPVMTSNTTPSGECSANSSYASTPPYYAFNQIYTGGNGTTGMGWVPNNQNADNWCEYDFTSPIIIYRLSVGSRYANDVVFKLQAYNESESSWVDLTENIQPAHSSSGSSFAIVWSDYPVTKNIGAYSKYRLYQVSGNLYGSSYGVKIQFYGRASSEVFVPLVPTMTSNTTPSGVCSASSEGVYYSNTRYAYFAFNGGTSGWVPNSTATNNYIQYTFPAATKINAVKMTIKSSLSTRVFDRTFTILASNDNFVSDSHELGSVVFASITGSNVYTKTVSFVNDTAYTSYRLFCSDQLGSSGSWMLYVYCIQFYAKTVQTNIIHSAANDTIYMMENGSPVVLTTTNSDGNGILDFSQFMDGTYTLYSSVAKDPNNLSNDYSKSVRITKTSYGCTTEAYLMPDTAKTLYWYGYERLDLDNPSQWPGQSANVACTKQTNYYNATPGSASYASIGKKGITETLSKAHAIVDVVSGTAEYDVALFFTDTANPLHFVYKSALALGLKTLSLDYSNTVTTPYCISVGAQKNKSGKVYALWYE